MLGVCAAYLWFQAYRVVVADDIETGRAATGTLALVLGAASVSVMLWSAYVGLLDGGRRGPGAGPRPRHARLSSLVLGVLGVVVGAIVDVDLAVLLVSALLPATIAAYLLSQTRPDGAPSAGDGARPAAGEGVKRPADDDVIEARPAGVIEAPPAGIAGPEGGVREPGARFSLRRVAFVLSVCGAVLFSAGLVADLTRSSAYREFFVTSDVSVVVLFASAAAYLRWGDAITGRLAGRVAGRCVQVWALLALAGQSLVWVRVARRGDVWWALAFITPVLVAAVVAFATVHVVLNDRARRETGEPGDRGETGGAAPETREA